MTGGSISDRIRDLSKPTLETLHPLPIGTECFTEGQFLPANGIMAITVAELTTSKTALNHPCSFFVGQCLYVCWFTALAFPYKKLKPCLKNNTKCLHTNYNFRKSVLYWNITRGLVRKRWKRQLSWRRKVAFLCHARHFICDIPPCLPVFLIFHGAEKLGESSLPRVRW
jgi:hypothetical protein